MLIIPKAIPTDMEKSETVKEVMELFHNLYNNEPWSLNVVLQAEAHYLNTGDTSKIKKCLTTVRDGINEMISEL